MPGTCPADPAQHTLAAPRRRPRTASSRLRLVAWALALALALASGPGQAPPSPAWNDAGRAADRQHDAAHARDPRPPAAETALARLRLEGQAPRQQAWADNRVDGPVQVQVHGRRADNLTAVPALPRRVVLPAHGSVLLSRLYPSDPRYANPFDLVLEALPGDPAATPQDTPYRLPFAAVPMRVDQGIGGRFSHRDAQNYYALDFALPEGTPVLAARDGTVMQVESGFAQAGLDRETFGGRANFVRILHADGSMALYAHLSPHGVAVHPGQHVTAGQPLALSGNTGLSAAPHLHFVLQVNRGMRLESIPFRLYSAQGELHFARPDDMP